MTFLCMPVIFYVGSVCVCMCVWWVYVYKHKTATVAQAAWKISYMTNLVLTRGVQPGKQNLSHSATAAFSISLKHK